MLNYRVVAFVCGLSVFHFYAVLTLIHLSVCHFTRFIRYYPIHHFELVEMLHQSPFTNISEKKKKKTHAIMNQHKASKMSSNDCCLALL